MLTNPVIEAIMSRKSIRSYTEQQPTDVVIQTIVRAGQQAPFAAQLGSLLLKRGCDRNPFKAPLLFTLLCRCPPNGAGDGGAGVATPNERH